MDVIVSLSFPGCYHRHLWIVFDCLADQVSKSRLSAEQSSNGYHRIELMTDLGVVYNRVIVSQEFPSLTVDPRITGS